MNGCICCHGPTDQFGNCPICDSQPTIMPTAQTPIISDAVRKVVLSELLARHAVVPPPIGIHVQSLLNSTTAPLVAEIERLKDKNKQTAKDFETAFRLVREENDALLTRAETAERERDALHNITGELALVVNSKRYCGPHRDEETMAIANAALICVLATAQKGGEPPCAAPVTKPAEDNLPVQSTDFLSAASNAATSGPIPEDAATPRTDAAQWIPSIWEHDDENNVVRANFARTLERELTAERAARLNTEEDLKFFRSNSAHYQMKCDGTEAERDTFRAQLRESEKIKNGLTIQLRAELESTNEMLRVREVFWSAWHEEEARARLAKWRKHLPT